LILEISFYLHSIIDITSGHFRLARQVERTFMGAIKWESQQVHGRDEVLRNILTQANLHGENVVASVRSVMHDYEVDMYRLVLTIGKHYGMERAFEIMSETVAAKRLRWLEQVKPELILNGNEIDNGLEVYRKYFKLVDGCFEVMEKNTHQVLFKRHDFIDAIAHACDVLGLDVIEVNNKVYAKTMDLMFQKLNLHLKNTVLKYDEGWYEEMVEVVSE